MAKKKKKQEIILTPKQQQEADYQKAVRRMEGAEKMLQPEDRVHMYKEAIEMFEALGDYEDSEARKKRCKKRLPLARREYREEVYQTGMRLKEEAKSAAGYDAAIAEFHRLRREYRDIPDQISECKKLRAKAQKSERRKTITGKICALAVTAAVIAFVVFLSSGTAHYLEGSFLMSIGDYERANTLFLKSKGYKDTDEKVLECNYKRCLIAAENGDYEKAVKILYQKVGDYKDALEKKAQYEQKLLAVSKAGDTVTFGTARWFVADTADGGCRLLVRSRPVRARTVYQTAGKPAVWETSRLRTWLNGKFYQNCFSEYEQKAILQTQVVTRANSVYGTYGGRTTDDRVFLLDESEAERYRSLLAVKGNQRAWWLRTPGKTAESAAYVMPDGTVMHYGYAADTKDLAVRPAVWVCTDENASVASGVGKEGIKRQDV